MARPTLYVTSPMMPCPSEWCVGAVKPLSMFYPANPTRLMSEIKRYPVCRECFLRRKREKYERDRAIRAAKANLNQWINDIGEYTAKTETLPTVIKSILDQYAIHKRLEDHDTALLTQILQAVVEVYPMSEDMRTRIEALYPDIEEDERQLLIARINNKENL